jgi:hypothetical protein
MTLVGERRAVAAAVLAFYGFLFLLVALQPPPGWGACFAALAGIYGLAFFSLVAGYFWARWFAIGVGMSGLISASISMFQVGWEPVLAFYGGTHGGISLLLWGRQVAARFDGRAEWRDRFHMDENATHRLGKAVIRVGISLPYIIMYALAPREGAGMGGDLLLAGAVGLALSGVWGLLRLRAWAIPAMAAGAVGLAVSSVSAMASSGRHAEVASLGNGYALDLSAAGVGAAVFLTLAVAPFLVPLVRYLRGRGEPAEAKALALRAPE